MRFKKKKDKYNMDALSIGAVVTGPVLILGIIMYGVIQANIKEIKDDWTQYRCNPLYMPFVSQFSETGTYENFAYCTNSYAQSIFEILTNPIHLMFSLFTKLLQGIIGSLNNFRSFTTGIQTFILSYAKDLFGKLGNSMGAITGLFNRIRDLSQRIIASAGYTAVIASTSVNFLISVFDFSMSLLRALVGIIFGIGVLLSIVFPPLLAFFIPIGAALGMTYSCFHPDTKVQLANGKHIFINEIRVGDELLSGKVTAVMRFDAKNVPMYNYNGVIVAGNHLVKEYGKWKYVKDAHWSYLYMDQQPSEIICLNTTTHEIHINKTIFSDYEECDDEPPSYVPLSRNDKIDGIPLKHLKPGMHTAFGDIMGVVYLEHGKMQVFIDNEFNGMFLINDEKLVRDYPDSHDQEELQKIQEGVLQKLNRKT